MNFLQISLTTCALICAAPVLAAPAGTHGNVFDEKGTGYRFEYSYPPIVNTFPALKKQFDRKRSEELAVFKDEVKAMLADMSAQDAAIPTLARDTDWKTITNLPGYLSLSVNDYEYDGGAHGMYGTDGKVWDKKAAQLIDPLDMFASKKEFDAIVQKPFCDKLDAERSERREGAKIDRSQTDDWMQGCPLPSAYAVLLGSSNGKAFNRFAIYVGPYGAGPYSEGAYEIDLPMSKALIAKVKPAYRAAFALK